MHTYIIENKEGTNVGSVMLHDNYRDEYFFLVPIQSGIDNPEIRKFNIKKPPYEHTLLKYEGM